MASEAHGGGDTMLTVVLKALNLVLFFGLLFLLIARPIRQFFESRDEAITDEIQGAKDKIARSENLLTDLEERIKSYEMEEKVIQERFEQEIHRLEQEARETLKKDLETQKKMVDHAIEQQLRVAREDLRSETLALSSKMAEKILTEQIEDKDRKAFAERMLEEISS